MSLETDITEMKNNFKSHQDSDANYFKNFNMELIEMKKDIKELKNNVSDIKELNATQATDLGWIKDHLKSNGFVKREEFKPVRNIVYGLVGITLTTVLAALIRLIVM